MWGCEVVVRGLELAFVPGMHMGLIRSNESRIFEDLLLDF